MSKSSSNKDDDNHGDAHETPTSFVYKDDIEDDTKFRPQTLWDNSQRKLLLFIMEGVGIIPPEGGIQIKLRYEPSKTQKLKYKTAPQYSEDPKWNELCYFDLSSFTQGISAEDLAKCQLTMEYVSVKKNASLGEAVLCVPTDLPEETVFDAWIDFKRTLGKGDLGTVHVRALYSTQPETVAMNWDWRGLRQDPNRYMYLTMKEKVKTGDIICYDGIGTLPALTKLVANSSYSRLGLIFEAPSKYSRQNEFYLLEVTRNRDKFQDAFKEARVKGVNVFRLWDRIHQVQANRIWWAPLSQALPPGGSSKIRDWIWELHDPATHKPFVYHQALPQPVLAFLDSYHWSSQKFESEMGELFSGRLILQALSIGGAKVAVPAADQYTPPIAVMTRQLYEEPILIRSFADRRDTVSMHTAFEVQNVNSPIVAPKVTSATANIPKLEVQKAETPLKNPSSSSPSSPSAEDKTSPRKENRSRRDREKTEAKKEDRDNKDLKDSKEGKDKKAADPLDDLTSPRSTLGRIVHRKRDRKEEGAPTNVDSPRSPSSLVELPNFLKIRELARKLSETESTKLTLKDWVDKLKEASFENSQAASIVFNAIRAEDKDTVSSIRLGKTLALALWWLSAEEPIADRATKALEIFDPASGGKLTKKDLELFGLSFLYLGGVTLTQIFPSPQVSDLSPESVQSRITDPLFDEEWEMFSATSQADEGDADMTNSLMSALGKKGGLKRSQSAGSSAQALPIDRVIKWFKREQSIPLLIDLERELASAQLATMNSAQSAEKQNLFKGSQNKTAEERKERREKDKDEKKDKEKEAKETKEKEAKEKDVKDKEEKDKQKKEKETKDKETKEKEARDKAAKDLISPRPSSRPSMFKRDNSKRETAPVEVKPKLRPEIIEACAYFFEENLEQEGIFRISGSARNVARIYQNLLDPHGTLSLVNEDVHDVTGAFKQYLRSVDPPIFPFELFDDAINFKEDPTYVQSMLKKFPADNLKALERLIRLLMYTAQKSSVNKMDMNNLSIVFGPTLIRPAPERESPALYMEANEKSKNLVLYMTSKFDEVFVGEVLLKMYS